MVNWMRIGHGYDLHRLEVGKRLVICGEEIELKKGVLLIRMAM